jgi:hypothetical protein
MTPSLTATELGDGATPCANAAAALAACERSHNRVPDASVNALQRFGAAIRTAFGRQKFHTLRLSALHRFTHEASGLGSASLHTP